MSDTQAAAPTTPEARRERLRKALQGIVDLADRIDLDRPTFGDCKALRNARNALQAEEATPAEWQQPAEQPRLTVRVQSFPESNGRRNWTALLVRTKPWGGLIGNCGGMTIARGELWNRVAYEAECARALLGERDTEPDILDYGDDIETPEQWAGEVRGGRSARPAPPAPTQEGQQAVALHPATADLVRRFSQALADKLAAAERKYGYSDGWADPDWMDECRQHLREHIAKGDPRDVAAYCAFLWHHGASTAPTAPDKAEAVLRGWRIKHFEPQRAVAVTGPHGGCVAAQCPTEAREIPEAILYELAMALLEGAPPDLAAELQECREALTQAKEREAFYLAATRDAQEFAASYGEQATALRSALDRVTTNFRLILARKPVRDVAETLAECDAVLRRKGGAA